MKKTIDVSGIDFPDSMPKMENENVFFCKWIKEISEKRKKKNVLFVITDWEFFVLYKKKFKKKIILLYKFKWFDITEIENTEEYPLEFTIHFSKQYLNTHQNFIYRFRYEKAEKLLKMFYQYIVSFQSPNNLPIFSFPSTFIYPPAKHSIIEFIRMKARRSGHFISQGTFKALTKFLQQQPKEFLFSKIQGIVDNLPLFLQCIYLAPSIQTLIVPFNVNFDSLKYLIDFLKINQSISSIHFRNPLPQNFSEFTNAFLHAPNDLIQTLKFDNCNFSLEDINQISKIIRNKSIESLYLENSLNSLTSGPFISKIQQNPGFQNISNLCLDFTSNINIRLLMRYLANVKVLSLVHCDFEIADFFEAIQLYSTDIKQPLAFKMNSINISENRNNKQILLNFKLPQYISVFVMKNIIWDNTSFNNLMECILNHQPLSNDPSLNENEIKLDISHASMPPHCWDSFFNLLETLTGENLVALRWNNNPIDTNNSFISFLEKCKKLRLLSLIGCFNEKDVSLSNFLELISQSKSLQNLSIAGNDKVFLGTKLLDVLDAISSNCSIKILDISNQKCGDKLLKKLSETLLSNKVIEEIYFQGNNIKDIRLYNTMFNAVQNRGVSLYSTFPTKECNSMMQYGVITQKDVDLMMNSYKRMITGNTSSSTTKNGNSLNGDKSTEKQSSKKKIQQQSSELFETNDKSPKRQNSKKKKKAHKHSSESVETDKLTGEEPKEVEENSSNRSDKINVSDESDKHASNEISTDTY